MHITTHIPVRHRKLLDALNRARGTCPLCLQFTGPNQHPSTHTQISTLSAAIRKTIRGYAFACLTRRPDCAPRESQCPTWDEGFVPRGQSACERYALLLRLSSIMLRRSWRDCNYCMWPMNMPHARPLPLQAPQIPNLGQIHMHNFLITAHATDTEMHSVAPICFGPARQDRQLAPTRDKAAQS